MMCSQRRRYRRVSTLTALALAIGLGMAQTAPATDADRTPKAVSEVLEAVRTHPSLRAAAASVAAAEARLQGAQQPIELQVDASWARLAVENDTQDSIAQPTPQVSVQAVAHPFLYGDLADRAAQLETELLRARLAFREVAAQIETQAVDALAGVLLAERGLGAAERAADLARTVANATAQREARGAARPADLARAEHEVARANAEVATARERLEFARLALAGLTGGTPISLPADAAALPQVPIVDGAEPSVTRAEWDAFLAQVGLDASYRNLLPVAQASYTWNLAENRGSVSVGLESRTLSPSLSYRTSSSSGSSSPQGSAANSASVMGPAFADLAPMQSEPPMPRVTGQFAIGVSLTLSPERFHAIDASEARLEAAQAAVEAARNRASTNRRSLLHAVATAERQVQLAATDLELARSDRADVEERVGLGLATPLELQESDLSVARSQIALLQSQHRLLRAQLDIYVNTATPLSEVLK